MDPKKPLISVNGTVMSAEKAFIPATDRGVLYGESIVEVLVCFHGKILNLDKHLNRLEFSTKTTNIDLPWSRQDLKTELEELVQTLNVPKCLLRIMVTRGTSPDLHFLKATTPNKYVYAFPAPVIDQRIWTEGVRLKLEELPFTDRGSNAKTGNYMRSIQNVETAKTEGFDDILQVNSDGEITESSTANIFLIGREGDAVEIATPSESSGLLLGITRDTIIELLEKSQIKVTERIILADEVARFDEGFICSTVRGLVPVASINDHRLHSAREKSIFQHIRRLHHTWAETQIGIRVDWNTGAPVGDNQSLMN